MNLTHERMLLQQATKARYKFALGALVLKQGRVVGAGYNRAYDKGPDCAELLALKKTPKSLRPNSEVVVARFRSSGTFGMAKPCDRCEKALRKAGVKKVYYSSPEGWKEMML